MSATTVTSLTLTEPVDLTTATANTQHHLQTFLQRVKEGRTELTIQKVETGPGAEEIQRMEMQRLEILSTWSKAKKAHKCNYKGCDKVGLVVSSLPLFTYLVTISNIMIRVSEYPILGTFNTFLHFSAFKNIPAWL